LLALFAFGLAPRLFTLALIAGAVVLTGYMEWKFTGDPRTIPEIIGTRCGWRAGFHRHCGRSRHPPSGNPIRARQAASKEWHGLRPTAELRLYTSAYATPRSTTIRQLIIGAALIISVVIFGIFRPALYASGILIGLAGSAVITVGLLSSILIYISRFRSRAFGLIAGTTPQRRRNLLDVMAAVPKPTVETSLVPWLNDCLNALAGLPEDQVMRFGHLWSGLDYHQRRVNPSPDDLAEWRLMSESVDHRLVNLELMTTDVTRQRPFRFPLDPTADK
jgi:hypothetical protein